MVCPSVQYFPCYLINKKIFEETFIENKMCVPVFCITSVWNISRSEKIWGAIKMYIDRLLTYPLFLSDFHDPWIFSTNFLKVLVAGQHEFEPKYCHLQTKSRTISILQSDNYFYRKEAGYGQFLMNGFFSLMPTDWTKLMLYIWYFIIIIFGTKSPLHQKVMN
jgi:hypothetical protein